MKFLFGWAADGRTLEVWTRRAGHSWDCWRVSPTVDNEYELYAYGRRVLAVGHDVASLLVRLLPYDPDLRFSD